MPQESALSPVRRIAERVRAAGMRVAAETVRSAFAAGRIPVRTLVGRPTDDGVAVLMCAWARIDDLPRTMRDLGAQTDAPPLDLYVWNNRRHEHARLVELVTQAGVAGGLRSVTVVRSPFNLGSIARFYVARMLWRQGRRGHALVIDDDMLLPPEFASTALAHRVDGGAAGFWAWTLDEDYWDRTRAEPGDRVDHLGPAGVVFDLAMTSESAFFHDVPRDGWFMDDVWFSHWAISHGMPLERLPIEIPMVDDDKGLLQGQTFSKIDFHERLRRMRG